MSKYPIRCPECNKELFTDGSYLGTAPDKPDPQDGEPFVPQDVIVKAAETLAAKIRRGASTGAGMVPFAQVIEAQIKAVRKLFRNHESRMKTLGAWQTIYQVIINQLPSQVRVYDLERKVEELEEDVRKYLDPKTEIPQPQAKGGVARCKGEDGKKHKLIPGVSVYTVGHGCCERIFHHQGKNITYGYQVSGSVICDGDFTPAPDETCRVYWLRDLDFPGGGDKELLAAAKRCLSIFQELADKGRYPEMLVGEGWGWLVDAIRGGTE